MAPDLGAVSAAMARVRAIETRFAPAPAVGVRAGAAVSGGEFAATLQSALGARQSRMISAGVGGDGVAGDDVVAAARRYLGVPYLWGGTDPARGLDCSALVQRVYADLGVELPRVAADQAHAGVAVDGLGNARAGDLLFFDNSATRTGIDHVGIYLGDGRMLEAPRPGLAVREAAVPKQPVAIRRVVGASESSYDALMGAAEARYGLPTGLLSAVAGVESGGRADAVSPAGARGLMQLMPTTARALGVDPMDPAQAVDGAARLLAGQLHEFGSVPLALAAYNAGGPAVRRYGGVPPYAETQGYVRTVLSRMGNA